MKGNPRLATDSSWGILAADLDRASLVSSSKEIALGMNNELG